MIKANQDIRSNMEANNIKYWQVAYEYGVNESTFTRKLRVELKDTEKEKINNIIYKLIKESKQ